MDSCGSKSRVEESTFPAAVRRPVRCGAASSLPRIPGRLSISHTILIADDSLVIREALRALFAREADFVVCGEAENGSEAVVKVTELHPDVVILDLQMPVINGLDAARQITRLAPNTAMVMLTLYNYEQLAKDAKAAGIRDVISKSEGAVAGHLLASLRSVCAGP
jgi:DNA-binding NarL/FixJ family response regulator